MESTDRLFESVGLRGIEVSQLDEFRPDPVIQLVVQRPDNQFAVGTAGKQGQEDQLQKKPGTGISLATGISTARTPRVSSSGYHDLPSVQRAFVILWWMNHDTVATFSGQ